MTYFHDFRAGGQPQALGQSGGQHSDSPAPFPQVTVRNDSLELQGHSLHLSKPSPPDGLGLGRAHLMLHRTQVWTSHRQQPVSLLASAVPEVMCPPLEKDS
jgi:hypothetical protein